MSGNRTNALVWALSFVAPAVLLGAVVNLAFVADYFFASKQDKAGNILNAQGLPVTFDPKTGILEKTNKKKDGIPLAATVERHINSIDTAKGLKCDEEISFATIALYVFYDNNKDCFPITDQDIPSIREDMRKAGVANYQNIPIRYVPTTVSTLPTVSQVPTVK
jgi:hypothetical protein